MRNLSPFRFFVVAIIFGAFLSAPLNVFAAKHSKKKAAHRAAEEEEISKEEPAGPPCKASILMDASSGDILAESNADEKLPPASMVKIMVAYVAAKQVRDGIHSMSDVIKTSIKASKIGGSQVFLKESEEFTLQQLMEALMIQSANDAATAIAEFMGGSVEGFVNMMNDEAKILGMKNTIFHTPHGLPPSEGQEDDLSTPRDMVILGRAMIRDFPELIQLTGRSEGPFRDGAFQMRNHNNMLRVYEGCDGIKTGFHHGAGFCITATAVRNNVRMITAVMGCKNIKARTEEASKLLSSGFAQYRPVKLVGEGDSFGQAVQIKGGIKSELIPVAATKLIATVRATDTGKVSQKKELCTELKAPVVKDSKCGSVAFMLGEREIGRVDAIVKEDVALAGWREKLFGIFK